MHSTQNQMAVGEVEVALYIYIYILLNKGFNFPDIVPIISITKIFTGRNDHYRCPFNNYKHKGA